MKILKDCWSQVYTSESTVGAVAFEDGALKIYVESGLDIRGEIEPFFKFEGEYSFTKHCVLVFSEVNAYKIRVNYYQKIKDAIIWSEPKLYEYGDVLKKEGQEFLTGGSRRKPDGGGDIELYANKFEIQILTPDEQPEFDNQF
jgi:hypothetical protein